MHDRMQTCFFAIDIHVQYVCTLMLSWYINKLVTNAKRILFRCSLLINGTQNFIMMILWCYLSRNVLKKIH